MCVESLSYCQELFLNQRILSIIIIITVEISRIKTVECTKKQGVNAHLKCLIKN